MANTSVTLDTRPWYKIIDRQTVKTDPRHPSAQDWGAVQRHPSDQDLFMPTTKVERAGVCFGVGRPGGPVTIEVRLNHDTISALRGVQVGFELLNGTTPEQAKKILDVLNENVIGVLVTSASASKTQAASS